VLLPACLVTGLSTAQLESILAHELAHIRRHDYLVNLLQTLVETLFFYHPAVWWLSHQIRNERENCCDDVTMATVGSRADYGRALLAIEELRAASSSFLLAASGGSLLARIRRVAGCEPAPRVVGGGSILGAILVSLAIVGAATLRAAPAERKPVSDTSSGSKNVIPDPMTLLQAYEKTLVPYQRMKGTWACKTFELRKGQEPRQLKSAAPDEFSVYRDTKRAKVFTQNQADHGVNSQWHYENVQQGDTCLAVFPGRTILDRPGTPVVVGQLKVTAEDLPKLLCRVMAAEIFGVTHELWIPEFLRASKLSAETDTLEGNLVYALRGVCGDVEIKLWLDPRLGFTARKIVYFEHHNSPDHWFLREFQVKRFRETNGIFVPVETTVTHRFSSRPIMSPIVSEKMVGGKLVREEFPARDKDGKIVMIPEDAYMWEIKLLSIDLDPKFTEADFKISQPVPDGTPVSVQDVVHMRHVSYELRDGKAVKVVEAAVKGKFNPAADVKATIAKSLAVAKRENEHVLVIFGANAWQRCAALEEAFHSNLDTLWPLLDEFECVHADLNNPANRRLAIEYGLALDNGESPCWTVLDADGRVLRNQDLAAFQQNGRYDGEKLAAFLKQWMAVRENAQDILNSGLARAVKEQKKVFFVLSGKFCGPCHRLINLLKTHHEALKRDYVLVTIDMDRTTHGEEVEARVGCPSGSGVPWYAVLSPTGEKLITSTGPKGNIGFPSEQNEIEHFMKMIRQTSSHISPEQMKVLEEALAAPAKASDPTGKTSAEKAEGEKRPAEPSPKLMTDAAAEANGKTDVIGKSEDSARAKEAESKKSPATSAPTAKEAKKQELAERTLPVHVVDVGGKPIAGVKVFSNATATRRREIINRDCVSNADGLTVVELPKTVDLLRIWARKDGLVPMFAHWEQEWFAAGRPAPDEVTIILKKGTTIGGFVKNEEGKPIAGAKVGVAGPPNLLKLDVDVEHVEVDQWLAEGDGARITDAAGRWTLDNVPDGNDLRVHLSVTHPDYISDLSWGGLQELQGVTLESLRKQEGTIVMARGISLTGSVTDPHGKGIAGAVVVWGDDPYDQTGSHQEHRQEVRTDATGVYRLPPMSPTTMTVTVIAEGWKPELKEVAITRENPKVDFQLEKGKTLRIRFVDSSGKPIPAVWVGIQQWRGCKSLYNTKHAIVLETRIPNQAGKNGVYEWTWAPDDEVQ
ncbi:MAG: M56 family metallopeptidase, partial [Thermoguttaceae bacterium]